jgi:flagellar biogenesis protein FliO
MLTVLGLVGIVVFCICVIALAAAVTWLVVKLSPSKAAKPAEPAGET